MGNVKLFLNIITLLYVPYIHLGLKFLQVDVFGADETIRSYNSIIGLIINVIMWFFIISTKHVTNKNSIYKCIVAWVVLIILQTFLTGSSILRSFITLHYVTFWCTNFLFFYIVNSAYPCLKDAVVKRMVFLVGAAIISYWFVFNSRLNLLGFVGDGVNISYFIVCMAPWVMLINNNKRLKIMLLIICSVSVLVSVKRTAIIAFVLMLAIYMFFKDNRNISFKQILGVAIVTILGVYLFVYIDQNFLDGSVTNRFMLFDDGMGKRDDIKVVSMSLYEKSSITNKIIGHGYNSLITDNPLGLSAHNDYIETLYDHGVIMLLFEVLIIIKLIVHTFKLYKNRYFYFCAFASSVVVFGVLSYSSHMILYPYYFIFLTSLWGFVLGSNNRQNEKELIVN